MIDRLAPGSTALSTARVGGTALSLLAAQCAADARELRACRARWRASSVASSVARSGARELRDALVCATSDDFSRSSRPDNKSIILFGRNPEHCR